MPFDFDELTDRRDSYSLKWDVADSELPMWVADMDFRAAPAVIDAVCRKAATGIWGYTAVPEAYLDAVSGWWAKRHGFQIEKEWIVYATGVVPAVSSVVRKLTDAGENVLIQPPVYNIFYNSILNNGRHLLENRLIYENGSYRIDFDDLEEKLSDPQTTLMILCNPHNPIGKIWDGETLFRIGELCAKHRVTVLSDEIHCDLTRPGVQYTPFASVSENCRRNSISCIAPTKAFNLAGLQTAAVVTLNPALRHKVNRALNTDEIAEPNAFAIEATIAAFTRGESWLNALNVYIQKNKDAAAHYIEQHIPGVKVVDSDATYLIWLDCGTLADCTDALCEFIRKETGLFLSAGGHYGESGRSFLRMNVATPRARVLDGLERLKEAVDRWTNRRLS